jgi:hypothetical protein
MIYIVCTRQNKKMGRTEYFIPPQKQGLKQLNCLVKDVCWVDRNGSGYEFAKKACERLNKELEKMIAA